MLIVGIKIILVFVLINCLVDFKLIIGLFMFELCIFLVIMMLLKCFLVKVMFLVIKLLVMLVFGLFVNKIKFKFSLLVFLKVAVDVFLFGLIEIFVEVKFKFLLIGLIFMLIGKLISFFKWWIILLLGIYVFVVYCFL